MSSQNFKLKSLTYLFLLLWSYLDQLVYILQKTISVYAKEGYKIEKGSLSQITLFLIKYFQPKINFLIQTYLYYSYCTFI